MQYIVNSHEMKRYDKNTIEKHGMPSMVLMERAALSVFHVLTEKKIPLSRVLVVCGCGNNGGDGYAVARLLALSGSTVDVVRVGDASKETDDNRRQREIWQSYGGAVLERIPENTAYTAVLDALFGVGLSRNVEGIYADSIAQMNACLGKKIAIDIASGISADSGAVLGTAFRADYTVTFAFAKLGCILWPGNQYAGEVIVQDIGIHRSSFCGQLPSVVSLEDRDLRMLPVHESHANKGTFGRLLVIAGSAGMSGAAYLSARAAYCSGCGLVRIVTAEENRTVLQTQLPEAILTAYSSREPDIEAVLKAVSWADAIVCGPGIGTSTAAQSILAAVLSNATVPVLLDADALNLLAQDASLLCKAHTDLVVTPHLGEMSRLCGDTVSYIQNHLLETAEKFAGQYNVLCVLKDEHTAVSVPGGRTYLNLSGNCGMATAGSGDVLSGIIGGLMAQGMSVEEAAALGVYLHGKAGDVMQQFCGKRGLLASDLTEGLRRVLREYEEVIEKKGIGLTE